MKTHLPKLTFLLFSTIIITCTSCLDEYKGYKQGCMDPLAVNYDSTAEQEDYKCVYPDVYSCSDERDDKYNTQATVFSDSLCDEPATVNKFVGEWNLVCDEGCSAPFTVSVYNHADSYKISLSTNFGLLASSITIACQVKKQSAYSFNVAFSSNGVGVCQIMGFKTNPSGIFAELTFKLEGFTGNYDGVFKAHGVKVQ